jgi:foldase protein PrsA
MKKILLFIVLSTLFLQTCGKKQSSKLKEGTPEYELAKEISMKVSYFDPEENNVLVSTKNFDVTTGDVIKDIYLNSGRMSNRLKSINEERLKGIFLSNAKAFCERKLILIKAEESNITVDQSKIDSVMNLQYLRAGSKEKFIEQINQSGISRESVEEQIQKGLLIQEYFDVKFFSGNIISEAEIKKIYNQGKTATVQHILLSTQNKSEEQKKEVRKKMEGILERVRSGEDFGQLAKEYSEDPGSRDKGGLYEKFGHGSMVEPFEEVSFTLPIGKISDIVETRFGYHIIKVLDREKENRPYMQVRNEIEQRLAQRKKNEFIRDHIEELKAEANYNEIEF